jgi:hypothetical protein
MKKEMKIKMRNFSHSSLSFLAAGKKGTNVHKKIKIKNAKLLCPSSLSIPAAGKRKFF